MDSSLYSRISEKYEQLAGIRKRIADICECSGKIWNSESGNQYYEKLSMLNEYTGKLLDDFRKDLEGCRADEKKERLEDFRF